MELENRIYITISVPRRQMGSIHQILDQIQIAIPIASPNIVARTPCGIIIIAPLDGGGADPVDEDFDLPAEAELFADADDPPPPPPPLPPDPEALADVADPEAEAVVVEFDALVPPGASKLSCQISETQTREVLGTCDSCSVVRVDDDGSTKEESLV
jgi:hypothetical protein